MTARRNFLAFVGSTAVVGAVTRAATAVARPTLILPPALVLEPAERWPLLAEHPDRLRAILHAGMGMTDDHFCDWLEAGLQLSSPTIRAKYRARHA